MSQPPLRAEHPEDILLFTLRYRRGMCRALKLHHEWIR